MHTTVNRTDDFEVDGTGAAPAWQSAAWLPVAPIDRFDTHATRAKLLYSARGLYGLFDCADDRIACTDLRDGDDLWTEDVVELFLWPDESQRVYFEYELSPLGRELPLLVSNAAGTFMGWSPWHYDGDRRVRRATAVRGRAATTGWSAEFFVPFALLRGLANVPPIPGTRWRANLCRIDHDAGSPRLFSWATGITTSFHAIEKFGTLTFG